MNKAALIMAGGTGTRAGGGIPKQFRNLAGQPIIFHSIRAFLQADPATRIIVVAHPDYIGTFKSLFGLLPLADRFDYEIVAGGATRLESVQAGISKAFGQPVDLIAVHDAARPLVSAEMIAEGWQSASEQKAAVPVVPVVDSLRKKEADGATHSVKRADYMAVQTPQVFDADLLREAYGALADREDTATLTDDASVVEAYGQKCAVYSGIPENIKITNPQDFVVAEALLALRKSAEK